MNFYTARELRNTPKELWKDLEDDGMAVITKNGKPAALMFKVDGRTLEETAWAVRQVRFNETLRKMRARAESMGFMTDEEIEAEIAAAREEMHYAV
ncbi:MAG: hypothetical protein SPK50_08115 [Mobiluncus porci]|uniref:hypothetical protein n=1 Tax=Mobiluncus porci TaxID=2652278 RepID=UPI0023F350DD|nr:hypothetical protein [Mobiluncus porci]MDD7542277.1 hypothetical protein [Mobiluncus porci]MDY5749076.1 hypothetical protein [Mobiluncus porci]